MGEREFLIMPRYIWCIQFCKKGLHGVLVNNSICLMLTFLPASFDYICYTLVRRFYILRLGRFFYFLVKCFYFFVYDVVKREDFISKPVLNIFLASWHFYFGKRTTICIHLLFKFSL